MLVVHDSCQEHLNLTREFADKVGKRASLDKVLDRLDEYACHGEGNRKTRCHLFKDFAPYSFDFRMEKLSSDGFYLPWFNGGVIWHSSHDGFGSGNAPTFSVSLTAEDGWVLHT